MIDGLGVARPPIAQKYRDFTRIRHQEILQRSIDNLVNKRITFG